MTRSISLDKTFENEGNPLPLRARGLIKLLQRIRIGALSLQTPEGEQLAFGNGEQPRAQVTLRSWQALQQVFSKGDVGLAEAYRDGELLCDDLAALVRLGIANQHALEQAIHGNPLMRLFHRIRHRFNANTRRGSRRNIQAHYDLGNDFYRLWLDPSMTYSSALFADRQGQSTESAQAAKYQRILDLSEAKPGDTILEIGCGWGGFAEHAARQGIRVHGITLSREQLAFTRERIEKAGLTELASFELRDYRDMRGQFSHIASIEMIEAVGEEYWHTYFDQVGALLRPGGNAVIQSITIDDDQFHRYRQGSDFIQQYIFPGGMLPSQGRLRQLVAEHGMQLHGMDGFGLDYAETLRRWRGDFEKRLVQIKQQGFDEAFIRLWRFYLAYCEAAFDEGRIDVVHLKFSHAGQGHGTV